MSLKKSINLVGESIYYSLTILIVLAILLIPVFGPSFVLTLFHHGYFDDSDTISENPKIGFMILYWFIHNIILITGYYKLVTYFIGG